MNKAYLQSIKMLSKQRDRDNCQANSKQASANSDINLLLQAVTECSAVLSEDEDFDRAVKRALAILGTSINADRVGIGEQHDDLTGKTWGYMLVTHEWFSVGNISQLRYPELNQISCEEFSEDYSKLLSGNHAGGLIDNFPEPFRSKQKKLGVQATYAIPIMVQGKYWGLLGLDFCLTARGLMEAEVAVFKTAATCIGSAIQRERNRQAREQAECRALLHQQKAEELQIRNRLQSITAQAAQALLNNDNLDRAIAQALEIIGRGIETDRVAVMEHYEDPTASSLGFLKMLHEWHSPHVVSQLLYPNLQQVSYEGIEDWYENWQQGEAVGGIVDNLGEPVRSEQIELGIKSLYTVPIAIDGQYWGVVGFDDCKEAQERGETEISILKTIAACIGSAIQQNRTRQEREQAERTALLEQQKASQLEQHNLVLAKRDRLLWATAKASNILLTEENLDDAVNKALKVIGEAADTDRAAVAEHFPDPSNKTLGSSKLLYEWHTSHTPSQLTHHELSEIEWEGAKEIYRTVVRGETHSGVIDEMNEPFRSQQKQINVKSTYTVPIIVEGQFWGFTAFDDCREVTCRSEAELSILKTAAACIGSTIQQERIRREKETAEHNILWEREQAAMEKAEQLRETNLVLSLRERWLEATANAANKLLKSADLDVGINAALKILGESLDCDRLQVWQLVYTHDKNKPELGRIIYEWSLSGVSSQISHPSLSEMPVEELGEKWLEQLLKGEWVGGAIDELTEPFHDHEIELNAKSTYIVPFFLNGNWWGTVSMDFCRQARRLTLPEIAVFKTAASCIGSAISRQQIQKEKERAELAIFAERNRIAREIHDSLAQSFTGISLQLEMAKDLMIAEPLAAQERLTKATTLAKEGVNEARRSVKKLRSPLLEFGLDTALQQLVAKMLGDTQIATQLNVEGKPYLLRAEIKVELYRIATEAITNILRHAEASEVTIWLIYEVDAVYLQIRDDGIGFDCRTVNEGFGLLGMGERCDRLDGNLVINSEISKGTEITVAVAIT